MSYTTTTLATMAVTAVFVIAGAHRVAADRQPDTQVGTIDATALQVPDLSSDASPPKKAVVGSWLETVTFPPETGRPALKSLVTFHADGTLVCSDQGAVSLEPPSVFTSCHGAWTQLQKRTFAYTQLELISDLSGNLFGYLKVRGIYTVSPAGNAYSGNSFAEIVDTNGNVLFSAAVTNAGQRIPVQLP